MKRFPLLRSARCALVLAFVLSSASAGVTADEALAIAPNQLSAAERAAGWKLLFDGKTTQGWRSFKKQTFPEKGWVVDDGCLKLVANGGGGHIITVDQFNDFELQWEWRIPSRANNGLKYFVVEEPAGAIGHEYQLIDDTLAKHGRSSTASFYEVLAPKAGKPLKAPGEWNHSKIFVQGNHVEHWLNGTKVLEFELGSDEVRAGVANGKFKNVPGYGAKKIKGHILLTDHRDEACFRNLKIRELTQN